MPEPRSITPGAAVRWGIVGGGPMAAGFAADLRQVDGAEIVAVTSRTVESAARAGARLRIDRVHPDLEAFSADDTIDVAYVATPHHTHAEITIALLEAGVAVVCEKPFALDGDEARRMVGAARDAGVFCMEAMWTRFLPAIRRARAVVSEGGIGDLLEVHADFSVNVPIREGDRRFDPSTGGGALLDLGVYTAAIAALFAGPVESAGDAVAAHVSIGPSGVDERVTALLRHESGATSVLGASIVSEGPGRALLVGTTGTIGQAGTVSAPGRVIVRRHGGPAVAANERGGLAGRVASLPGGSQLTGVARKVRRRLGATRVERLPANGNGYTHEIDEVHRCLQAGRTESEGHDLDTTVRVADLLDRIRRASSSGS